MRISTLFAATALSLLTLGFINHKPVQAQSTPSGTTPGVSPSNSLGIIEASATSAPAVLNFSQAQSALNQANQYVRIRAIRDMMRGQERRDLLLSDYVGNQNYNRATAGQQFGRLAWDTYYESLPFTDF